MADTGKLEVTAQDAPEFVVDAKGRKIKVILTLEVYEALLEDLHDLALAAERREEPLFAWEDLKRELQEDGTL